MNINLTTSNWNNSSLQVHPNSTLQFPNAINLTSLVDTTAKDLFASLDHLDQAFQELENLMNWMTNPTFFKNEKLMRLQSRSNDLASPLEYIKFPFEQSIDLNWIQDVDLAISYGRFIKKAGEEISTSYTFYDASGKKIALFKLYDKSFLQPQYDYAQSALREHLTWVLGKDLVPSPATYVVEINIKGKATIGSLQKFIESVRDLNRVTTEHWKMGQIKENFNKIKLPWISDEKHAQDQISEMIQGARILGKELLSDYPSQVRGIALLDILVQNEIRSDSANTLVYQEACGYRMIPINHKFAFPKKIIPLHNLMLAPWFANEAVRQPFSDAEVRWLNALDIEAVKDNLLKNGLETERVNTFGIMAELVQTGARAGLTVFDITSILLQPFSTNPFPFYEIIRKTLSSTKANVENVSAEIRKKIINMVMEKRDQITQFGMSDDAAYQERFDEVINRKQAIWEYISSMSVDTCSTLSKMRQTALERYNALSVCPKEYLDARFNYTRPGKPLEVAIDFEP